MITSDVTGENEELRIYKDLAVKSQARLHHYSIVDGNVLTKHGMVVKTVQDG